MDTFNQLDDMMDGSKTIDSPISTDSRDSICSSPSSSQELDTNPPSCTETKAEPSSTYKDYFTYLLQLACSRSTGQSNTRTRATLWLALLALAFAAYQVYLQRISNLWSEKSYKLSVWKDCHDRQVYTPKLF
jgi:hypothetical protein